VGGTGLGANQYRWLEAWIKDNASGGYDYWPNMQTNQYQGRHGSGSSMGGGMRDDFGGGGWSGWCADVLPHVRKIVRGEPVPKALPGEDRDSEHDFPMAAMAGRARPPLVTPSTSRAALASGAPAGAASRHHIPHLSKAQQIDALMIAAQRRQHAAGPANGAAGSGWS